MNQPSLPCERDKEGHIHAGCDETPVFRAARAGCETVKWLVGHGARVDVRTREGRTALFPAVERGNLEAIRCLLEMGIDLEAESKYGTALRVAIDDGRWEAFALLREKGAKLDPGWTFIADDPASIIGGTRQGESAIHRAVRSGPVEVIKVLAAAGVDVNRVNDLGETALHVAVARRINERIGRADILVAELLNAGANPNIRNNAKVRPKTHLNFLHGATPLHYAARENRVSTFEALVKAGADVNAAMGEYHVFQEAAVCCDYPPKAYARINIDAVGLTPLHLAVLSGSETAVSTLLRLGANPVAGPPTPLELARKLGNEKVVQVLTRK